MKNDLATHRLGWISLSVKKIEKNSLLWRWFGKLSIPIDSASEILCTIMKLVEERKALTSST